MLSQILASQKKSSSTTFCFNFSAFFCVLSQCFYLFVILLGHCLVSSITGELSMIILHVPTDDGNAFLKSNFEQTFIYMQNSNECNFSACQLVCCSFMEVSYTMQVREQQNYIFSSSLFRS